MSRNWIKGLALIAVATPVVLACSSQTEAPPDGPAAAGATTPARTTPLGCVSVTPGGGQCISLVQHPMRPAETSEGYATEVSWTLTNQCPGTMAVTWNWGNGDVGGTTLAQGQDTDVSCLWNIDGCTGNLQFEYRCAEIR